MEIEEMHCNGKISTNKMKQEVSNMPWVQRYRPNDMNDLVSHEGILHSLRTFIKEGNLPNLLFYGPPGTGKTSTILAVAKQLYKKDFKNMVLQLNASDERGIDVVREQIKNFAATGTLFNNPNMKLVVLDEADMMTNIAQFALRRIIQKYHSNARFCLISNYVSKIIPALQSRCTRFKFKQIPINPAKTRIQQICRAEHLKINDDGVEAVFRLCKGDMRRVVNMLQSLSMIEFEGQIGSQTVYDFTGHPSPEVIRQILEHLFNAKVEEAYKKLNAELKDRGIALETIMKDIYLNVIKLIMPVEQKSFLVKRLGDIEYRMSIGCQESLLIGSLIGAFTEIRYTS